MFQIDNKLISHDIFEQRFSCDISKCEGFCYVDSESGEPLEDEETLILEKIFPLISPFLQKKARKIIEKQGTWEIDFENEKVTPLINGGECAYAVFEDNICKCAIEIAYNKGLIDFVKPISCHLYPIRISKFQDVEALNYHSWHVCEFARELGKKTDIPVFRFLKAPIIRKYGEKFFHEMEEIEKNLLNDHQLA
jgi:hypothetical protein